jgi:hypothetical protein
MGHSHNSRLCWEIRQERTMTSSGSLQGSSGDALDHATRHLRVVTALLMRLCKALAAAPAATHSNGNGSQSSDLEVWSGLYDVLADLVRTAEEIERLAAARRSPADDSMQARPDAGTNGHGEGLSAAGLAGELARDALSLDLGAIIENNQDDWSALVRTIRSEKFHGGNGARDENEPLELYSRVITTLPVELRRDFRRLTEWRTADEIAERQAAFELGRQIERQARANGR